MANYKRRRPRSHGYHRARQDKERQADMKRRLGRYAGYIWLGSWPRWWDVVLHRRPNRAANQELLRRVKSEIVDFEDVSWPLAKKPHNYFW